MKGIRVGGEAPRREGRHPNEILRRNILESDYF
jgi:hypothetical protein